MNQRPMVLRLIVACPYFPQNLATIDFSRTRNFGQPAGTLQKLMIIYDATPNQSELTMAFVLFKTVSVD